MPFVISWLVSTRLGLRAKRVKNVTSLRDLC
jgi:hypothetical protein